MATSAASPRSGLRGARRSVERVSELVHTGFVPGREDRFPLVVTPAVDNVDLPAWCKSHAEQLLGYYDRYGAILFRGFDARTAADFEAFAASIAPDLFADYNDLPPEDCGRVYGVTPYPEDQWIFFHNEGSHLNRWPLRQFFFCIVPPATGGTTPLFDCREVYDAMLPEIRDEFERKGLLYVRNFAEGIDVPWQRFFRTEDRAQVERQCAEQGLTPEWTDRGLRLLQPSKAVRTHPRTGEKLWFNQIQLHHISCVDEQTRTALRQLFDDRDLPRNVYFGDGTPIADDVVHRISELYEDRCVEFTWQPYDLVGVDNMLIQHARRPYTGDRKILVAMGAMVYADDEELRAPKLG